MLWVNSSLLYPALFDHLRSPVAQWRKRRQEEVCNQLPRVLCLQLILAFTRNDTIPGCMVQGHQ